MKAHSEVLIWAHISIEFTRRRHRFLNTQHYNDQGGEFSTGILGNFHPALTKPGEITVSESSAWVNDEIRQFAHVHGANSIMPELDRLLVERRPRSRPFRKEAARGALPRGG